MSMVDAAAPPPTSERAQSAPDPGRSERPLRVAIDATPMLGQPTGVGAMTGALINALSHDGEYDGRLAVTGFVVSWRGRGQLDDVLPLGCQSLHVPLPARVCHHLWRRFDRPRLGGRFDVVHGTNYVVPPSGSAVELVTVHDLTAWRFPHMVDKFSAANPVLVDRALARGAHVHCVSKAVAAEVIESLAVSADRVHVISNGVDAAEPGDAERGRSLIAARYVLAIGTIEPRKDYLGLLKAMQQLWLDDDDLKLVIVGANGWGSDEFESAVQRAGAEDRLVRLGYVEAETKAHLLAGAELLAFPSVYEGFGLPVLEAMQAGVPVVSSLVPAIEEVAGGAALLVPPGHPDELAEAMSSVIGDDELRRRLIADGRSRVGRFSWSRTASEFADLYRRLAGEEAALRVGG